MPPKKKPRKQGECVEVVCKFSECEDVLVGSQQFLEHVELHVDIMRNQLDEILLSLADTAEEDTDVDRSKCECPWRDCDCVLDHQSDWGACKRHILFHPYQMFLQSLGSMLLQRRGTTQCCRRTKKRVAEVIEPLVCNWGTCQYTNDNHWSFFRHVDQHCVVPSEDDVWKCHWSGCKSIVKEKPKLIEHLRRHTQEKMYACAVCGQLFANFAKLSDHHARQTTSENNYECSHCCKQFPAERILRDHLRKHVNLYSCMFCDMTCANPSALRVHILYRHSTERPFSCVVCGKRFKREMDVRIHQQRHEMTNFKLECDVEGCNYQTKAHELMDTHKRRVHQQTFPRIYECHLCGLRVDNDKQGTVLGQHLRGEHKLDLPSGHVRFRFAAESDGIYRLVTVRYECMHDDDIEDEESLQPIQCTSFTMSKKELSEDISVQQTVDTLI